MSSKRLDWAVEVVKPEPDDRILEIGCGGGKAVELLWPHLPNGKIIALDRSSSMIAIAERRNKKPIEKGIAEILHIDFEDFLPKEKFNKVFAFNVNVFWLRPDKLYQHTKRHLTAQGEFFLFYELPTHEKTEKIASTISQAMAIAGFDSIRRFHQPDSKTGAFCIRGLK